jgi:ribose 5-phosphate isomerase B
VIVAVGCDHAGFPLKERVLGAIRASGHQPIDLGTYDLTPCDYPDFAREVGRAVQSGRADRGILLCGSGVGVCVAANKVPGVRACLCHDSFSARQGVEHDGMNVLCLGARVIGPELAAELVRIFLAARFSGEERHVRRLKKIAALEQEARGGQAASAPAANEQPGGEASGTAPTGLRPSAGNPRSQQDHDH